MQLCRSYVPVTHMERAIQARLCGMNKMTFMSLANTFPEYTWITLFKALNNLERQQLVKLTPVPWDYEITILSETTLKQEGVERSRRRAAQGRMVFGRATTFVQTIEINSHGDEDQDLPYLFPNNTVHRGGEGGFPTSG